MAVQILVFNAAMLVFVLAASWFLGIEQVLGELGALGYWAYLILSYSGTPFFFYSTVC